MNDAFLVTSLALVVAGGTAVVLVRDRERQAVTLSVHGLLLGVLFVALQAPDVALSQLVVGIAVVPLMVMLTIRKVRGRR